MTHLSADERLALIEAAGGPEHPHLADCVQCREEVDAARDLLAQVQRVAVPEPSPLFWDVLSRRVSEQVAASGRAQVRGGRTWWRVLVPLAAGVGALLLAVGFDRPPRLASVTPPPATAAGDLLPSVAAEGDDEGWSVLLDVAGDFDVDTLSDSLGGPAAGTADGAVWRLSDQERVELGVLLRAELRQVP